ncbi:DNA helicase UvrD [Candidatus Woesearchaeota archaeon]|nr:DNA helicase UvrD [Candidatus Woesearchaeota archaeon]
MKIFADLHIHSRFSRATSKDLNIKNLETYAKIKGLNLLGTGDFTHPEWIKEIKQLNDDGNGIFKTATGFNFLLQTEISLVYTQDGKGRRIHHIVYAPDLGTVDQITEYLKKHGRVDYDGRPIFSIESPEFVYELKKINQKIEIVPAHAWTPWFGIFGSMSGFDSMEKCFKDQTKEIFAIETGLSSDPEMNWRLSALDKYTLMSNSDCHSFWPWRLGREANVFELKTLNYDSVMDAIKTREGFLLTIEVDPSYGKYHFDGHRNCGVYFSPAETKKNNGICPACRKPLTIGVLNRVEELADRPEGFKPESAVDFKKIIPLSEILSAIMNAPVHSKKVFAAYYDLLKKFHTEFNILLDAENEELVKVVDEKIADAIMKNRNADIKIRPGYDGEYGVPVFDGIVEEKKETKKGPQRGLGEFF